MSRTIFFGLNFKISIPYFYQHKSLFSNKLIKDKS